MSVPFAQKVDRPPALLPESIQHPLMTLTRPKEPKPKALVQMCGGGRPVDDNIVRIPNVSPVKYTTGLCVMLMNLPVCKQNFYSFSRELDAAILFALENCAPTHGAPHLLHPTRI